MYKEKNKTYFLIAIIYWILYMIGLLIMGILYKKGIKHYNIIYLGIAIIGVSIAIIKDKNLINLGFTKEKLKINFVISFISDIFYNHYHSFYHKCCCRKILNIKID